MNITGAVVMHVPRYKVWLALHDPAILAQCIDGFEVCEKIGDQAFSGRVTTKIGLMTAHFSGVATVSNSIKGTSCKISGEGKDSNAGTFQGGADIRLEDIEGGAATRLNYTAHASPGGQLAQLDSRLIESTARAQLDHFFDRLAQLLAPGADAAVAAPSGLPAWVWIGVLLVAGVTLLVYQLS
jgi:uncharacterized protein